MPPAATWRWPASCRACRPTAVFVASDVVAIGAMRGLREAGLRVPADVSIVGFDDIPRWPSTSIRR